MLPITECNRTLAATPRLAGCVGSALLTADMPVRYHTRAAKIASYLYVSGWLEAQESVCTNAGGYVADVELIELKTDAAIKQLQTVGLLPVGVWAWVFSFTIRWFFTRFIESLITEWLEW